MRKKEILISPTYNSSLKVRLEGSRTLLEFLHRIHFHVDFQPHLQVASFPPPTCPISTGGGQVFYLDAKTLAPPTTKQFTPYLPYLIRPDNEDQLLPLFITTLHVL